MRSISSFEINNPSKKEYSENVVENPYPHASLFQVGLGSNLGIKAAGPLVVALKHCGKGDQHAVFLQRRIENLVCNNDFSDKEENNSGCNSAPATLKPDQRSLNQQLANNCAVIKNTSMSQGNNALAAYSSYDFTQNIKKRILERTMVRKKIKYKIPKIAHYIWLGNPAKLTKIFIRNIINCAVLNPDYKVKLWVDNAEKMKTYLINERYSSAFFKKIEISTLCLPSDIASAVARECTHTRYKNYAAASDIIRLSLLKDYGGIYMDVDVARQKPLGLLLPCRVDKNNTMETLYHLEYRKPKKENYITYDAANGVIACVKGSKDIHKMLEIAMVHYGITQYGWGGRTNYLYDTLSRFSRGASPFLKRAMRLTVPGFAGYVKAHEAEDFIWRKKRIHRKDRLDGTIRATGPDIILNHTKAKVKDILEQYKNINYGGEDILSSMKLHDCSSFGQIKLDFHYGRPQGSSEAKRLYNINAIFGEWVSGLNDSSGWLATDDTLAAAEI